MPQFDKATVVHDWTLDQCVESGCTAPPKEPTDLPGLGRCQEHHAAAVEAQRECEQAADVAASERRLGKWLPSRSA